MIITKESIEQRFYQYGGILRYILPQSLDILKERVLQQNIAINNVMLNKHVSYILNCQSLENDEILEHIAQYEVPRKIVGNETRFRRPGLNFASSSVYHQLTPFLYKLQIRKIIRALLKNDESPTHMKDACNELYEIIVNRKLKSLNG